jgi:hypothetical protein
VQKERDICYLLSDVRNGLPKIYAYNVRTCERTRPTAQLLEGVNKIYAQLLEGVSKIYAQLLEGVSKKAFVAEWCRPHRPLT